ncbi:Crp/Fnr family transcriptional regulator [Sphingomonas sp.]|uniref:Crp/Fnr family transcriptional regulator n=1 Tax=Sphingomonas sp. TaxID=28214 RepID=UPI0035C874E9
MQQSALLTKMASLVTLTDEDRRALEALSIDEVPVARRRALLTQGARPDHFHVLLSGWAARYEVRADGSRRITGFMLPGDFCGIHAICHASMDHAIIAITDCVVGRLDAAAVDAVAARQPAINQAIWRAKLIDEAVLRKWLLFSTDAYQSVAHLLCELYVRASTVGLAARGRCRLPLTQEEIGDALGITAVHTNRVIQRLRNERVIDLSQHELTVLDAPALTRAAAFDRSYLAPWIAGEPSASLD